MGQAWSHVFLSQLIPNKGKTGGNSASKWQKIWMYLKIIKYNIVANGIFLFAEVYWVIYRIRWKNKNFDVMGTLKVSRKGVWRVCRQKNVTLRMNFWTTLLQWHINCSTVHEFCSVCCQHLLRLIYTYNFQLLVCVSFQFLFQFYWF